MKNKKFMILFSQKHTLGYDLDHLNYIPMYLKSILLPMTYKGAILTPYLSAINFRKIEFEKWSWINLIFGLFQT